MPWKYSKSPHPCSVGLIYFIRLSRLARASCIQRVHSYIKRPQARARTAHPFPRTAMASLKKKRAKPIIHRNIPAEPSVSVKAHEFKRASGSRLVSTTTLSSFSISSTSLAPQTAHETPDDPTDIQVYSDVEGEMLEKVGRKGKKRPSHSVNVSIASCSFLPYPT